MDTRELLEWAAKYHTPNYARAPICLVRGDGVRVWDSDGKEYLDFGAGIAVASLGHCRTFATVTATGQEKYQHGFEPLVPGFKHVPYNDLRAMERAIDNRTAALIVEPIQGEGGVIVPDDDYLPGLRKLCDASGALLILDEVQTGVGRTGTLLAYEHSGIEPDVMPLAKALANGVPIGAMLTREEVARALGPGTHGSTFGGTPFVTSVALATLQTVLGEKIPERAARIGRRLMDGLRRLAQGPVGVREVRGRGVLIGGGLDARCGAPGIPARRGPQAALEGGTARHAARRPHDGADLREAVPPDPRHLRGRDRPARRARRLPLGRGDRPGHARVGCGRGAEPRALGGRYRRARLRARDDRDARLPRDRPRNQRALRLQHPCQALADFFTLWERGVDIGAMRLAWIGDGNNVCHSVILLGALLGASTVVACPPGYEPAPRVLDAA